MLHQNLPARRYQYTDEIRKRAQQIILLRYNPKNKPRDHKLKIRPMGFNIFLDFRA